MKRRILNLTVFLIMMSFASAGCAAAAGVPELSEEQSQEITEYAAGLMLKHDTKYSSRLLSKEELEAEEAAEKKAREIENAYKEAAAKAAAAEASAESEASSESDTDATSILSEQQISNIAEFYGVSGLTTSYTGYELTGSYPNSGDDIIMAIDASDGTVFLVLKFDVSNTTSEGVAFDMFYKNPKFAVSVDGNSEIANQVTLLLDDMATYAGEISGNSTVPMVLIFEVSEDITSIGSMTLRVSNADTSGVMTLQ